MNRGLAKPDAPASRRDFLTAAMVAAQRPAAPLNVIVILADDLGARDLGCFSPTTPQP